MKVEKDYADLLRLFNKHGVRYCIIGAFAVAFYVRPRYTKDLDLLVEPTLENGRRILKALKEFGFGSLRLRVEDFSQEGKIIQLGYEPVRVDLLTSVGGVRFDDVWKNKRVGRYGRYKAFFIGPDQLLTNKQGSLREQDKVDAKLLRSVRKRRG